MAEGVVLGAAAWMRGGNALRQMKKAQRFWDCTFAWFWPGGLLVVDKYRLLCICLLMRSATLGLLIILKGHCDSDRHWKFWLRCYPCADGEWVIYGAIRLSFRRPYAYENMRGNALSIWSRTLCLRCRS